MTTIITLNRGEYRTLTSEAAIALEAEAMRNTERRIRERQAQLHAETLEKLSPVLGSFLGDMLKEVLALGALLSICAACIMWSM